MPPSRRRVLVTGGGSGIGLAIARAFRATGCETFIAARNKRPLQEAGLPYVMMDIRDADSIRAGLAQCGVIDIFIASAGGAATAPALKTTPEQWDEMIALNLTSVFHCAQAAIAPMVERGWGRFIAIGSTASLKGYRYASAYAAAKHGVLGLVRSLALELAQTGVTSNAICPGYADTPMIARAVEAISAKTGRTREEAERALNDCNPMGRLVRPDEVAAAALYLASEAAAAVNGQAIAVDGGETA